MNENERGRFCDSCQKNVFDFTNATDNQIFKAFKEKNDLCGRFNIDQLNRDLIVTKKKNSIWLASTSFIISLFSLTNNTAYSQVKTSQEQTDKKDDAQNLNIPKNTVEVSGVMYDEKENTVSNMGLYHMGIKIAETNSIGEFCISMKTGDILMFWCNDNFDECEPVRYIVTEESKNM